MFILLMLKCGLRWPFVCGKRAEFLLSSSMETKNPPAVMNMNWEDMAPAQKKTDTGISPDAVRHHAEACHRLPLRQRGPARLGFDFKPLLRLFKGRRGQYQVFHIYIVIPAM